MTELLRYCFSIALVVSLLPGAIACRRAAAEPTDVQNPADDSGATPIAETNAQSEFCTEGAIAQPDDEPASERPFVWNPDDEETGSVIEAGPTDASDPFFSKLKWLGLRHSSFSGRNAGIGVPLVGTSWLNRPYYVGADLGTVWVTAPVNDNITTDIDMIGGVFGGYDWDHYWGTELAVHRATPELINEEARDADRGDRLMEWTASLMYYPWGDALFRPYWRCGVGGTEIDYPTARGHRRDEVLWTFPVGVGVKYPVRRWLAARAELADQLALGNSGVATQHDITLTFGLEWRFGAHPRSYWPWNPSRHIW